MRWCGILQNVCGKGGQGSCHAESMGERGGRPLCEGTWVPASIQANQPRSRQSLGQQARKAGATSTVADVAQLPNWVGFVTSTPLYGCIHDDLIVHSYVLKF